ncbi:hypothetical protein B0T16DRAFT_396166 [Cercophora newfieldiana]|uniref:Uncharacterized protein n=1 Tax=Cercophora newfieldiana TaxID=92897 RepID=A0AA40CXE8_9PEZI|nr:hypothetical protein B0T16DRAFT_396166 [Cercophora newfieldiana]
MVSTRSGVDRGITVQYICGLGLGSGPDPTNRRPRHQPRMIGLWSRLVYPYAGCRLTFTRRSVPQTFSRSWMLARTGGSRAGDPKHKGICRWGKPSSLALAVASGAPSAFFHTDSPSAVESIDMPSGSPSLHSQRQPQVLHSWGYVDGMALRKVWKRADGDWSACGLDWMGARKRSVVVSNPRKHGDLSRSEVSRPVSTRVTPELSSVAKRTGRVSTEHCDN